MSAATGLSALSPDVVYGEALVRPGASMRAHFSDGSSRQVALADWLGPVSEEDDEALGRITGPVLDIGCGAGRHVLELQRRGVAVLGIDVVGHAVSIARSRGARVLHRSIFAPVPGERRWAAVLLLDGNIGIGGDAVALLRRVAELLRPDGRVLLDVEPHRRSGGTCRVRIEGRVGMSHWFPWARLGVEEIDDVAAAAGFVVRDRWPGERRWFCLLERPGA